MRLIPWLIALSIGIAAVSLHLTIELNITNEGILSHSGFIHLLELKTLDQKLIARGTERPQQGADVVIAAIDEQAIARFGLWPWNREVIAAFITHATAHEPLAISFDAVFSDHAQNRDQHQETVLAEAIAEYQERTILGYINFFRKSDMAGIDPNEILRDQQSIRPSGINTLYEHVVSTHDGETMSVLQPANHGHIQDLPVSKTVGVQAPLAALVQEAKHFAFINAPRDRDGVVRRLNLFSQYDNLLFPSLALLTSAVATNATIKPIVEMLAGTETLVGVASLLGQETGHIPLDRHGRLLLRHYGPPEEIFESISIADIVDEHIPKGFLNNKIILFGFTAAGLNIDLVPTAFSSGTPGVYVHATAIQNILDGHHLDRWFGIALIEALAYLAAAIAMGYLIPRMSALPATMAVICALALFYTIDLGFLFPRGIWILSVIPTLQIIITFIALSIYGYMTEGKEKAQIRSAFQLYLNKNVIEEMLRDTSKLKLGGERRVCTVLFSDIRGFTTISEQLSPEQLVQLLNSYLTPMTDIILRYDGTLDKYVGDAIMAIFGAPAIYDNHAERGCLVALDMLDALKDLRSKWTKFNLPHIDIGIGLSTGPMSIGNMGSHVRFAYTAMGDHVNLASRLEGINKVYGTHIVVSSDTYEASKHAIYGREIDIVRVVGRHEPVKIYEIRGRGTPNEQETHAMALFAQALAMYRAMQWNEASTLFAEIRNQHIPNDPVSDMFLTRCKTMLTTPPEIPWDGVWNMTAK